MKLNKNHKLKKLYYISNRNLKINNKVKIVKLNLQLCLIFQLFKMNCSKYNKTNNNTEINLVMLVMQKIFKKFC